MNTQQANLADLRAMYYRNLEAERMVEAFASEFNRRSREYIATRPLDNEERYLLAGQVMARFRRGWADTNWNWLDPYDEMLRFYNVLEVGRLTEFIPEAFWPDEPDGLRWPQALLFLRMVVVGIQNHPPSLSARLPLLLARRLNDPDGLPQVVGSEPTSLMLEFLTLDKQFVRDHRCGELLYWLMGKTGLPYMSYSSRPPTPSAPQQTFSFESVVEAIAERPRFMASLFQPPQQRDWLGCALYELHQLLQFCFDLHRLLHRSAEYPLLQSEFWHHYGYWLGEHGQAIRSGLVKALTQFIQWVPETQDSEARTAVESYVKQARDVIEDLTSSKYEGAVSTLFSCPPEDETKHSGSK